MDRPSKKEIKAIVDSLKVKHAASKSFGKLEVGKPSDKKSSRRIRKQGV